MIYRYLEADKSSTAWSVWPTAHVAGRNPSNLHDPQQDMFFGLGLSYKADPAEPLTAAGKELDDLSVDIYIYIYR